MAEGKKAGPGEYLARSRESERKTRRMIPFAALLSLVAHAEIIFHEEIHDHLNTNIVRDVRAMMKDSEAATEAQNTFAQYQKDIEVKKPVDLDLISFYLNQEALVGGVSEADVARADVVFKDIIKSAKLYQQEGQSRDEVLGWILKQQGEYDEDSALVTDLLLSRKGNCEARAKFISAAFQELYPEEVKKGKLKTETFGAYVDENGEAQPGHIRVIVDRGAGQIDVLEGAGVKHETKAQHKDIPADETTQLAVKAFAAREGLYLYGSDTFITKEREKLGTKPVTALDSWQLPSTNSTMAYPKSAARYKGGRGTRDVESKTVRGSWAYDPEDWKGAIELELRTPRPKFTAKDVEKTYVIPRPTQFGRTTHFDLTKFGELDPDAVYLVAEAQVQGNFRDGVEHIEGPIIIRGDQKVPGNEFQKMAGVLASAQEIGLKGIDLIVESPLTDAHNLRSVPIGGLILEQVETLPNLDALTPVPGWSLVVQAGTEGRIIASGHTWKNVFPPSSLRFSAAPGHQSAGLDTDAGVLEDHRFDTLMFDRVMPITGAQGVSIRAGTFKITAADSPAYESDGGQGLRVILAGLDVDTLQIDTSMFHNGLFEPFWMHADAGVKQPVGLWGKNVRVSTKVIGEKAFEDIVVRTLTVQAQTVQPRAFEHLETGTLWFKGGLPAFPIESISRASLSHADFEAISVFTKAKIGRIVITTAEDNIFDRVSNLRKYAQISEETMVFIVDPSSTRINDPNGLMNLTNQELSKIQISNAP